MTKTLFVTLTTLLFSTGQLLAQQTIFTVDEDFDTEMNFRARGSVNSFLPRPDGRIIVGGGFDLIGASISWGHQIQGFGLINQDGSWSNDWGGFSTNSATKMEPLGDTGFVFVGYAHNQKIEFSPWSMPPNSSSEPFFEPYQLLPLDPNQKYQNRGTRDFHIMDDGSIVCVGALTTDTTQQNLWRHLYKFNPDGTVDQDFPAIEAEPNTNTLTSGMRLVRLQDGRWIMSGRFSSINGHHSPHLVRFAPDFEIDTTFVSPFGFKMIPEPEILLLDSEEHLWMRVTNTLTADSEQTPYSLRRLTKDGEFVEDFVPGTTSSIEELHELYSNNSATHANHMKVYNVLEIDEGEHFLIAGRFKMYNDTAAPGITVVNKHGHLRNGFFGHSGVEFNHWNLNSSSDLPHYPRVSAAMMAEDGSLIIGGAFSDFMGHERYNVVKLNRSGVNTNDRESKNELRLYPNPANTTIRLVLHDEVRLFDRLSVFDLSGRLVKGIVNHPSENEIYVGDLRPGMYLIKAETSNYSYSSKLIIQ